MTHSHFQALLFLVGIFLAQVSSAEDIVFTPSTASQTLVTDGGKYVLDVRPRQVPIPIGEMQSWDVQARDAEDGIPFTATQLVLNGGMPGHGHGLPSKPTVTEFLGDGVFRIDGIKFNMGGTWQMTLGVTGPAGSDTVTFSLAVTPPPENINIESGEWTVGEIALLKSLSLSALPELAADPTNRFSGNSAAAALGESLFFDPSLSASGTVSCATCHDPKLRFTDGRKLSFGTAETARHSTGLIGIAYHRWFYWDGRRDSLWAQAVTPLETPGEMDATRVDIMRGLLNDDTYGDDLRKLGVAVAGIEDESRFPPGAGPFGAAETRNAWARMRPADQAAVDHAFAAIGKILAAYLETLQYTPARFDHFVDALSRDDVSAANDILTADEQRGLRLFIDAGRTQCLRCHNGPLFTNFGFHNIATAVNDAGDLDFGRMLGLQAARFDRFNCLGAYSDGDATDCDELNYANEEHAEVGAFKVPGLRDVAVTAPYMHDGRFGTLEQVIRFYTETPPPEMEPHELLPLELSDEEVAWIERFLESLTSPVAAPSGQ